MLHEVQDGQLGFQMPDDGPNPNPRYLRLTTEEGREVDALAGVLNYTEAIDEVIGIGNRALRADGTERALVLFEAATTTEPAHEFKERKPIDSQDPELQRRIDSYLEKNYSTQQAWNKALDDLDAVLMPEAETPSSL